jgi:hypothetical protein
VITGLYSTLTEKRLDEVESLTAARASAMAGNEPSDALRVSTSKDFFIAPEI